jgi:hypothetical protein
MKMSTAEQQKRWRAAHGAVTGARGRPVSQPCGTRAAYRRHLKNGEKPDEACRAANAAHVASHRSK